MQSSLELIGIEIVITNGASFMIALMLLFGVFILWVMFYCTTMSLWEVGESCPGLAPIVDKYWPKRIKFSLLSRRVLNLKPWLSSEVINPSHMIKFCNTKGMDIWIVKEDYFHRGVFTHLELTPPQPSCQHMILMEMQGRELKRYLNGLSDSELMNIKYIVVIRHSSKIDRSCPFEPIERKSVVAYRPPDYKKLIEWVRGSFKPEVIISDSDATAIESSVKKITADVN